MDTCKFKTCYKYNNQIQIMEVRKIYKHYNLSIKTKSDLNYVLWKNLTITAEM